MTSSEPSHVGVPPSPENGESPSGRATSHGRELWVGIDQATVMSLELLSGILVWGGAGWLVDRWLGTAHWFFGVGVMLGFAAGLYLVWLRTDEGRRSVPRPATRAARAGKERARGGG
ncbi:MAG TPA: AtpZ/AtpI family protein [Egibacteraceae bacterium]|nr:AtpZ/AtpI family protein [Egibacteraceae bacterium]